MSDCDHLTKAGTDLLLITRSFNKEHKSIYLVNKYPFADDEPNCDDSGGLSPGAIVGIGIGCVIIVAVVVAALYWVRD